VSATTIAAWLRGARVNGGRNPRHPPHMHTAANAISMYSRPGDAAFRATTRLARAPRINDGHGSGDPGTSPRYAVGHDVRSPVG